MRPAYMVRGLIGEKGKAEPKNEILWGGGGPMINNRNNTIGGAHDK